MSKKWERYQEHMNNARALLEMGQDVTCWYQLLLAVETVWRKSSTEKQQRQQKLWQQRGLLELTNANLRSVYMLTKEDIHRAKLETAGKIVRKLIQDNIQAMKSL